MIQYNKFCSEHEHTSSFHYVLPTTVFIPRSFLKTLEATIQDLLGGCNSLTLLILEFYGDPEHEVIDSWIERPISGDGTMVVFIDEQTTN